MKKSDIGVEVYDVKKPSANQVVKAIRNGELTALWTVEILYGWMKTTETSQIETLAMLKEQGIYKSAPWLSKRISMWEHLAVEWQIPRALLEQLGVSLLEEASGFLRKQDGNPDPRGLLATIVKNQWTVEDLRMHTAKQGGGGKDEPMERVSISETTLLLLDTFKEEVLAKTGVELGRDKAIETALDHAYHQIRDGEWVPEFGGGIVEEEVEEDGDN